jgi:hypothetical protein
MKKLMLQGAFATIIGVSALAGTHHGVCVFGLNRSGDCWHTSERYTYRPHFGVTVHDDNWRWRNRDRHHRWREHEGRGYWRNGIWLSFQGLDSRIRKQRPRVAVFVSVEWQYFYRRAVRQRKGVRLADNQCIRPAVDFEHRGILG